MERNRLQEALGTRGRYFIGNVEESEGKNANMSMVVEVLLKCAPFCGACVLNVAKQGRGIIRGHADK